MKNECPSFESTQPATPLQQADLTMCGAEVGEGQQIRLEGGGFGQRTLRGLAIIKKAGKITGGL